jgi:hypothetical protein
MVKRNKQEILSNEALSDEEKQKLLDELRDYNRKWYHSHKTGLPCQWCKAAFVNQSSLTKHLAKNQKCRIMALTDQVEKLLQSAKAKEEPPAEALTV